MLTKDNNKCLFGNPELKKKEKKMDELYISQENNISKLKDIIKEQSIYKFNYDILKNKYNKLEDKNKILREDNRLLKSKIDKNLPYGKNNNDFINDDLMFIDIDIFEYQSEYTLKKKVIYYEKQLDILNNFFENNNISGLTELKDIISNSVFNSNNYSYLFKKYDNIDYILENTKINFQFQKSKTIELFNKFKNIDIRIKRIKDKIEKLPVGTIITVNGIKKVFKGKIEKTINKIKKMEQEYEEYYSQQISWAKSVIGNDLSDEKIVKILDIFNKINGNYNCSSSGSDINEDSEIYKRYNNRYNNIKIKKIEEFNLYCDFGKDFINDGINTKKDIPKELLEVIKEVIKSSDISYGKNDEKFNRFISSCKRYYILSQKNEKHDNIIRSKCKTSIRDMNNQDFDNLLKLIENNNKKE